MINITIHHQFSTPLLTWFDSHGRKDLPWQLPRDPYRVWISEIMLQQTQVQTVITYFNRFITRFPTVVDLAGASEDEVLSLWSGLGYYSRARNLHHTSKIIAERHQGILPNNLNLLMDFPGIGPSTAAAIMSQAFNQPTAILDGNVKRVLSRFFMIKGWPEQSDVKKTFWAHADICMPKQRCADYTQAIMDLGATCCTLKNPNCSHCPVQNNCQAYINKEQHLYPTKKIKKPVPSKYQKLLVLLNDQGQIYLEKRPPTGIWGGLWCFPSLDNDECPLHFIQINYALKGETPKHITAFKHKLTHLHFEINALSIKTQPINNQQAESNGQWFASNQLALLGLAKPTSFILNLVGQKNGIVL
ncbi:MAG: A/G-specific adenine glycosylase [Legionellales bacterium]